MNAFDTFEDTAKLWIFPVRQEITEAAGENLSPGLHDFISSWRAHKVEVQGAYDIIYNRFLFLAADERYTPVSGCSIDDMFRSLETILNTAGLTTAETPHIFFRDTERRIVNVSRAEFEDLVKAGTIKPSTIVFDNTIRTLGDYRRGQWELPFEKAWHAKVFS